MKVVVFQLRKKDNRSVKILEAIYVKTARSVDKNAAVLLFYSITEE